MKRKKKKAFYRILIDQALYRADDWSPYAELYSDSPPEIVKWLQQQARRIRKEPYMTPRLEGEEPLEGLG